MHVNLRASIPGCPLSHISLAYLVLEPHQASSNPLPLHRLCLSAHAQQVLPIGPYPTPYVDNKQYEHNTINDRCKKHPTSILDSDHARPEHRRVQHGRKFCHTHIAAASSAALQSHRSAMAAAILLWFCLHQICSVQLSPCCFWFGFTIALDSVCASQVHLHMRLMICDNCRCRWLSFVFS